MESIFSETKRSFTVLDQLLELLTSQKAALAVDLEDEIGRLRVWSSNLGAAAVGPASLDNRLRDAPMMKDNVLKLLKDLAFNAQELLAVFRGERLPYELQTIEPDTESEQESLSSDSESDDDSQDASPVAEADRRFAEIEDIINHLYKAWHRIRAPGSRARPLKAAIFQERDPETNIDLYDILATQDRNYVNEAILDARREANASNNVNEKLASRFANAITFRRRHLGYWEKHQKKLEQMMKQGDMSHGDSKSVMAPSSAPSATILSATEVTAFIEAGTDGGDDLVSEASSMSATSSVSGNVVALPPVPPQEDDGSFVCSLCYAPCPSNLGYKKAWRAHVFRDLQPYQCTYDDCPDGDDIYARKRDWLQHEQNVHRSTYWCPKHPSEKFQTKESLTAHLDMHHALDVTQAGKIQLTEFALKAEDDTRTACPICDASFRLTAKLHKHLAHHMERFAAFSLSSSHFETEDDSGDSAVAEGSMVSSLESSPSLFEEQSSHDDGHRSIQAEPNVTERPEWDASTARMPARVENMIKRHQNSSSGTLGNIDARLVVRKDAGRSDTKADKEVARLYQAEPGLSTDSAGSSDTEDRPVRLGDVLIDGKLQSSGGWVTNEQLEPLQHDYMVGWWAKHNAAPEQLDNEALTRRQAKIEDQVLENSKKLAKTRQDLEGDPAANNINIQPSNLVYAELKETERLRRTKDRRKGLIATRQPEEISPEPYDDSVEALSLDPIQKRKNNVENEEQEYRKTVGMSRDDAEIRNAIADAKRRDQIRAMKSKERGDDSWPGSVADTDKLGRTAQVETGDFELTAEMKENLTRFQRPPRSGAPKFLFGPTRHTKRIRDLDLGPDTDRSSTVPPAKRELHWQLILQQSQQTTRPNPPPELPRSLQVSSSESPVALIERFISKAQTAIDIIKNKFMSDGNQRFARALIIPIMMLMAQKQRNGEVKLDMRPYDVYNLLGRIGDATGLNFFDE